MLSFPNLKRSLLLNFVGILFATVCFAQTNEQPSGETIKSYFLLQLNLETDPIDLQNYFDALDFRSDFQSFANVYTVPSSKLGVEESRLLKWAVADGMNGDLDQSIRKLSQLLLSAPIQDDKALMAAIYMQMSRMMELRGDLRQATRYQDRALLLANAAGNMNLQALSIQNLGRLKSVQHRTSEAENDLLKRALPLFTRLKNQAAIADCYHEIARHYLRHELYTQSNWFYLQSLQTAKKAGYATGIINALIELGQYKYDIQSFAEAQKDWLEAEKVAINHHQLPQLLKVKFLLNRVYQQLADRQLAERYALEFEQLRDILLNPVW